MIYKVLYWMMVIGYLGVSLQVPSVKMKAIGLLLTAVNAILFYR